MEAKICFRILVQGNKRQIHVYLLFSHNSAIDLISTHWPCISSVHFTKEYRETNFLMKAKTVSPQGTAGERQGSSSPLSAA